MKTKLIPAVAIIVLTMACTSIASTKDKSVTITGEGQCAKCLLHEAKSCQTTITVDENGKKVTYYLAPNKVSKAFHENVCNASARLTATGRVKESHGKKELVASKIEFAK